MVKAIYVHVPFCETICAYCDFGRCKMHASLANRWLEAVERELKERQLPLSIKTIYIGGGTPTALSAQQLNHLLTMLDSYAQSVKEYTIEANPENLTMEKLLIMKAHGVNRISLGVQSFNDRLVKSIDRHHNQALINQTLDLIHASNIHNISIDLMYGLPNQTLTMLDEDLKLAAMDQRISHISIYSLTIEEHSKFGREGVVACDNELEGAMYELICRTLKEYGYTHYEISNFAKQGYESLHNQMYWRYEDYAGIGCGASGKENHIRYDRPFQLLNYINHEEVIERIELSKADEMFEFIMMGLRMHQGIELKRFEELFHCSLVEHYASAIKCNLERGWLTLNELALQPTELGMTFLNDVLMDFMP